MNLFRSFLSWVHMQEPKHKRFFWTAFMLLAVLMAVKVCLWLRQETKVYHVKHEIKSSYQLKIKPLIPQAIQSLKTNNNDWLLCTDVGLSLDNIDSRKAQAAFIVYYRYGKQYCSFWWKWEGNLCNTLAAQLKYSPDQTVLEKKITLCRLAQKV